jgi:hypothetical protein
MLRFLNGRKTATILASILSFALIGLNSAARAAPPPPSAWDIAFGCAVTKDYIFRGVSQSNHCAHPFIAVEAGAGWSNTNFSSVTPPFNVNGSGFVYGLNAGVLFNIPGTAFMIGPRIGFLGGQTPGSIANPPASPAFIYDVKTLWTFYQEAVVRVPINFPMRSPSLFPFITASAGIAEIKTQVTGTSGGTQVTDSATRTGFTFTGGFGIPVVQTVDGAAVDLYLQYRGTVGGDADVNIPGKVRTNYWAQGINFGVELRY